MLVFRFHKEQVGNQLVDRPRARVQIGSAHGFVEAFALIDSGADRTIIPQDFAELLAIRKGDAKRTRGVGGFAEGYESFAEITFVDIEKNKEKVSNVPVYILKDFSEVVIGRAQIFDLFRVIFDKPNNKIIIEQV